MGRFREVFDEAAFEQLLLRHHARAVRLARTLLPDHAAAQDAVQEAFVRVIRSRREFDPARSFSGWFNTILRNICTDLLRRRARRARQMEELAAEAPVSAFDPVISATASVDELLRPLPPDDREILILRVVEGRSFAEIAVHLRCSVEAAKKRAQRALRWLRDRTDLPA